MRLARFTQISLGSASLFFGLISTLFFVLGSSRLFSVYLPSQLANQTWLVLALLLVLTVFSYLLFVTSKSWKPAGEKHSNDDVGIESTGKLRLKLQIIISLLIFLRSFSQIGVALDWDEHDHVSNLASPMAWQSINPLRGTENHPLASLLAYSSMKVFGVSKFSARLPAILLSLFFLVALNQMALRYFSGWTSVFALGVLCGNGLMLYLMHSMRGYAPMILFTLVALSTLSDFTQRPQGISSRRLQLFFIWVGAAVFSHAFGGLFCGLLLATLIIWSYQNRQQLSGVQFQQLVWIFVSLGFWLILFAGVSLFLLAHLQATGFAMVESAPDWLIHLAPYRLFTLFGFVRSWEIKLFVLAVASLLALRLRYPSIKPLPFFYSFMLVAAGAIFILIRLLAVPLLEGRMLTPFLMVFLFWLGDSLERIPKTSLRVAASIALFLLLTLPFSLHHDQGDGVAEHFVEHEIFSKSVHQALAQMKSSPVERCFSFSGEPDAVKYARNFYFRDENFVEQSIGCRVHYHLFYGTGLFGAIYNWAPPTQDSAKLLYSDGKSRSWFEIKDRPLAPPEVLAARIR